MTPITVAEFARIKGVSPPAVWKAIQNKRLVNCLIYDGIHKKPRSDPVVAAQEWERNTDHSKRTVGADIRIQPERPKPYVKPDVPRPDEPPVAGGPSLNQSRAVREAYQARLAKLDYEERSGKLIDAEAVKNEWFKLITEAKTRLLAVPSKSKANIPHLTLAEVGIIERLIREALEDISNDGGA